MIYEPLLILGYLKKIIFLVQLFQVPFAVRAEAIIALSFRPERFAWRAEPALIYLFVYPAVFIQFAQYRLDRLYMMIIGCPDETIVLYAEFPPQIFEYRHYFIHKFLLFSGLEPARKRSLLYLLTMLICARHEEYVVAFHAIEPRDRIYGDIGVRMSYVGLGVYVI